MPSSKPVRLLPHDASWPQLAEAEARRILDALDGLKVEIHHVGSTAIPGISAKPVIDLLAVMPSLPDLDRARAALKALGYVWRGENGITGRRYCTLNDPQTGQRKMQLHCFPDRHPAIRRHLAFREYLRTHPEIAAEYEQEKARCAALHPDDAGSYTSCKSQWIERVATEAVRHF